MDYAIQKILYATDLGPHGPKLYQQLMKAVEAFGRGEKLDLSVSKWVSAAFPPTSIKPDFVERAVETLDDRPIDRHQRLCCQCCRHYGL